MGHANGHAGVTLGRRLMWVMQMAMQASPQAEGQCGSCKWPCRRHTRQEVNVGHANGHAGVTLGRDFCRLNSGTFSVVLFNALISKFTM